MKRNQKLPIPNTLDNLANTIQETNWYFLNKAQQQVNTALTLRNWVIGYYIVEYEQSGKDRADYGKQLFKTISDKLLKMGIKSIRERHLYLCKDLYKAYPQILRTASAKFYLTDFKHRGILRTVSSELAYDKIGEDINQLLTNLSFSHFIELLKAESDVKRRFYEVQALKNNWGVRVENPRKLTPLRQNKLTPSGHFKLPP